MSLRLPAQEIVRTDGTYALAYEETIPVERWNAQISLLTGIAAASIMVDAGVGLLRTLPKPDRATIRELRALAKGLHIGWDTQVGYPERVRELDPAIPNEGALLLASARGLRGAGYVAFRDGDVPAHPEHSAIASTYSHVTAPLRRLVDRFANEIVIAACAGREPPAWTLDAIEEIPSVMGQARDRQGRLERGLLEYLEAATMLDRKGQVFEAVVSGHRGRDSVVHLVDPAVVAAIADTELEVGIRVRVRVVDVNLEEPRITLEAVGA